MRRSGEALHQVHEAVRPFVVPGASTMDLEKVAAAKMDELHAISAFKGYRGFPAVLCTSINDEVVHGIPSATRILAEGDIVSVDCGVIVDGFYSDSAVTYAVGTPSAATQKAAGRYPGLAGAGDPAGTGGWAPGRHLRNSAGDVRGRGLRRGSRVCRPRDRQIHARRPAGAQLRHARQRARG